MMVPSGTRTVSPPGALAVGPGVGSTATSPSGAVDSTTVRGPPRRSEEHTSELQSLMRISYAVFCLKKKTHNTASCICPHNHTHKVICHQPSSLPSEDNVNATTTRTIQN